MISDPVGLVPAFDTLARQVTLATFTQTQLAPANPNRIAIAFALTQGTQAWVWMLPNGGPQRCFTVDAAQAPLILTMQEHGGWPQFEWVGIESGAGVDVSVIESLYFPERISRAWVDIPLKE